MDNQRIDHLLATYRDGLLNSTLPFWFPRAVDAEHGGFMFSRDRDGSLLDTDKAIWLQGRAVWLLATLYADVEARPEWLAWAKHGLDFLRKHGFDADGRMFFLVDREGRPLRKRRYIFSETFMIAALAAYGRAAKDPAAVEEARAMYERVIGHLTTPGVLPPKWNTETRPMKGLAVPMIMTVTAQILREAMGDPAFCNDWIDHSIAEIRKDFMHPELATVLETVGPNGEFMDHFDGRTINPGHSIEAAWFILEEARRRGNDPALMKTGLTILDWMWERGWDKEHGGITYFVDVKGLPVQEYWHDMKFWWPQNEAIIATLMAYQMTGDPKYADWHALIHDWTYARFPDPVHGEWFGYLHRDGRLSSTIKGNTYKGAFHIPRMELVCWKLMEQIRANADATRASALSAQPAKLRQFLDDAGRVVHFSTKRAEQTRVLDYLIGKVAPGREYTERELTDLIACWIAPGQGRFGIDAVTLRRALVEENSLRRTPNGSKYWRDGG